MRWQPAYVGVGSNLGEPADQVRGALTALSALPEVRCVTASSLYGSRPLGPQAQPDFINAAAGLLTRLEPLPLLQQLRALEQRLGREPPRVRWGPRRIDLDLLVYGQQRCDQPQLTLPHPGIVQRNFVLYPLLEIAPELSVPGCGRVAELAARVDPAGIWRLDGKPITHGA
ncbi:MAG TPA: 2-amino-4-hydroxy-6-hydroxymethyldihydropteridine diphosphokinase [Steroidobacteraceae bacterium]|jgi:2-amino-4-hydroxy-6-hydroxymethyldihydropteridine diphosphokinase